MNKSLASKSLFLFLEFLNNISKIFNNISNEINFFEMWKIVIKKFIKNFLYIYINVKEGA